MPDDNIKGPYKLTVNIKHKLFFVGQSRSYSVVVVYKLT